MGGGVLNVPEDALCLTINATVNTSSVSFMGVETTGVCNNLTKINNTGVLHPSCCNYNNCNYPNNGSADYPTPLVCYEGIYYNGTEFTKKRDPAVCYGKCARFSAQVNGSSVDIYTCSPAKLCTAMNITNNCNSVGGIFGCCCDSSNVCLNPENNVVTPLPTTTTMLPATCPTMSKGSASLAISIITLITTGIFSLVRI
uniref:ET module n=1 Tax=Acrobeloides nanus TaxID=290746 RepID=A0A914DWC1_9BILA